MLQATFVQVPNIPLTVAACNNQYSEFVGLRQISALSFVTINDLSNPAQLTINVTNARDCGSTHYLRLESFDKNSGATLLEENIVEIKIKECTQEEIDTGISLSQHFRNKIGELNKDYEENDNLCEVEIVGEEDINLNFTVSITINGPEVGFESI